MRALRSKLEDDRQWRLGGVRIRETYQKWSHLALEHLGRSPSKVMDFGAGIYHPLANVAQFNVLHGSEGVGVELDPRFLPDRAAKCLADTIFDAWLHADPEARLRARDYPLDSLRQGEWTDRVTPKVSRFVGDVRQLDDSGFDFVFSQSVLEHVDEFDDVLKALTERTQPGGVHAHVIDMRDHRSYYRSDKHQWSFLCEEEPDGPFCNRLRSSQIIDAYKRHGFEIIVARPQREKPPKHIRRELIEAFSDLSYRDLERTGLRLVARRR
ncbi:MULTISPECIES: class I SAM-dependent methyltransferase [Henriciella]|jgi:SAM-dependent methyltransferase|nr:class I SAM-dependent methyltransferase [Henriciella pelagia]